MPPPDTLAIVEVRPDDVQDLKAFMAHVIATSVTTDEQLFAQTVANVNGNVDWWLAHAADCVHLKAMRGDTLVGVVLVKNFWNLCSLFVGPAEQGRGLGRALIHEAMARCRGRSPKDALWLNAAANAVGFYRHLGFRPRESPQPLPPGFQAMMIDLRP